MRPKLEISVSEMRELRNQGYSNKDIARILDISLPSVYRYIGGQKCHMESVIATPKESNTPPQTPQITVVSRVVSIDGYLFEISDLNNTISVSLADGQSMTIKQDEFNRFLQALFMAQGYMNQI